MGEKRRGPLSEESSANLKLSFAFLPGGVNLQVARHSGKRDLRVVLYVAFATTVCCNGNMEVFMNGILEAIFQRRAVKVFEAVEISRGLREQILDAARHAPSSFNMQPYRFYWVGSTAKKGGGGETLPWTDACGNRIGAGRGRRGHRIDARNVARPGGVDAQGRVQRSENPRL